MKNGLREQSQERKAVQSVKWPEAITRRPRRIKNVNCKQLILVLSNQLLNLCSVTHIQTRERYMNWQPCYLFSINDNSLRNLIAIPVKRSALPNWNASTPLNLQMKGNHSMNIIVSPLCSHSNTTQLTVTVKADTSKISIPIKRVWKYRKKPWGHNLLFQASMSLLSYALLAFKTI